MARGMGLTEDSELTLSKYGRQLVQNCRRSDDSGMWMKYSEAGALCDEHLMNAGMSCITHVEGNRCLSVALGKWLVGYEGRREGLSSEDGEEEDSEVEFVKVCGEEAAEGTRGEGGKVKNGAKNGLSDAIYYVR